MCLLQLVCSCVILYAMRYWKLISFMEGEMQSSSNNPATIVSFKTLSQTLPLGLTYLLYMVSIYIIFLGVFGLRKNTKFLNFDFFIVKGSDHGICSWHKCSHVHYTEANYCGLYNDCGVLFYGAETFTLCCLQV